MMSTTGSGGVNPMFGTLRTNVINYINNFYPTTTGQSNSSGTLTNTATAAVSTSSTMTITAPGTYVAGQTVTLAGFTPGGFNANFNIATVTATGFTINNSLNLGTASALGTATVDISPVNTPAQFINQIEAAVYLIGSSQQCSVQK